MNDKLVWVATFYSRPISVCGNEYKETAIIEDDTSSTTNSPQVLSPVELRIPEGSKE